MSTTTEHIPAIHVEVGDNLHTPYGIATVTKVEHGRGGDEYRSGTFITVAQGRRIGHDDWTFFRGLDEYVERETSDRREELLQRREVARDAVIGRKAEPAKPKPVRFIVCPLYDHTTEAEAVELADEIGYRLGLSIEPFVSEGVLPEKTVLKRAAEEIGIDLPLRDEGPTYGELA